MTSFGSQTARLGSLHMFINAASAKATIGGSDDGGGDPPLFVRPGRMDSSAKLEESPHHIPLLPKGFFSELLDVSDLEQNSSPEGACRPIIPGVPAPDVGNSRFLSSNPKAQLQV